MHKMANENIRQIAVNVAARAAHILISYLSLKKHEPAITVLEIVLLLALQNSPIDNEIYNCDVRSANDR